MKRYGLYLILMLALIRLNAQETLEGISPTDLAKLSQQDGAYGKSYQFDNRYEGVKGSVYVNEEWRPGKVFLSDGRHSLLEKVNYNLLDQEFSFTRNQQDIYSLAINRVDSFYIGLEEKITFVRMMLPDQEKEAYFIIEVNGPVELLTLPQIRFVEANYQGAFSPDVRYDEYKREDSYYLRLSGKVEQIKLRKKEALSMLKAKSEEIVKFIDQNNLNMRTIEDWKLVVIYYNSLVN